MSGDEGFEVPGYRIERTLARADGRCTVLARDLALDRPVVLKVLHASPADPARRARFLESARLLASAGNRHLVAIHAAGATDRLSFVDLEYLDGGSLAERRGHRLSARDAGRLARDLLTALDVLHTAGVVHGRVRADNVFRVGRRFVLGDSDVAERRAPGGAADDLQAAAVVLGEALAGGPVIGANGIPDWTRVPRRFRALLRRDWPDAARFRTAFGRTARTRFPAAWPWGGALAAVAAAGWWWWPRPLVPPGGLPGELAILPFRVVGDQNPAELALGLPQLLQLALDGTPGFRLAPQQKVLLWWQGGGRDALGGDKVQAARDLEVRWIGVGQAVRRRDSLRVALELHDSFGTKLPEIGWYGSERDLADIGDTLAVRVLRAVAPGVKRDRGGAAALQGTPLEALKPFLQGEAAFQRDAWTEAERHYRTALAADSTFALAEWRLANVLRWRREPYELNLAALYDRHLPRLRPLDRALIEALLESDLERRFELLETVTSRFPDDAYAQFLYGDEVFHRGPLAGVPMEESVRLMERAIARDSLLALAYTHLVFVHLRQGRRSEAAEMLAARRRVSASSATEDLNVVPLLELAYDERFVPWRAALKRRFLAWRADAAALESLEKVARFGVPWFDIPGTQLALTDLLLRAGPADSDRRAGYHEGRGLALFALGRPAAAQESFDSAAALLGTAEARLHQAEWRLVPPALGAGSRANNESAWRRRLELLSGDPVLGARAAWVLALDRYTAGDASAGQVWAEQVTGEPARPLRELLRALSEAARGRAQAALAITDSTRVAFQQTLPPDAFATAAFHLLRGRWALAVGDTLGADREWLWYEGSDVEGWPRGLAKAEEVSGALGVAARLMRGRLLLASAGERSDSARACAMLRRVTELWQDAEPAMRPLAREADSLSRSCR